ncbi:glycosylphosphatidylinositol anchor attachment 1 protein [Clonorchis sinensis]|uniref:Glycosylphosphatidylinositol anchor attachment 1 protein n=1 Tax=Clonorchis sinensis TaxID=79923 RepID=G7YK30_CLOSI|nr:glycosylphosphatidylinositol anchor attachment 1 protein [Clonorchis sinensis]
MAYVIGLRMRNAVSSYNQRDFVRNPLYDHYQRSTGLASARRSKSFFMTSESTYVVYSNMFTSRFMLYGKFRIAINLMMLSDGRSSIVIVKGAKSASVKSASGRVEGCVREKFSSVQQGHNKYALSTHKVQGTGRRRAVAEHETYNPGALGVVELVERSLLRYELICCMTETWAFRAAELRRFRVLDNPCLKTIARVGHKNTCVADALVFVALLMEHDGCLYDFEWVVSVKLNRSEQDYVTNIQGLFGYHLLSVHPKFGGFFSIEFCRDDLSWSEIQGRSGNIQAGLNLEFSHLDPSSVDILPEGTNGFLANLDLVNAVVRLANKHSIEPIVNNQLLLDLSWSEIQGRSGNIQAGLNLEFSHLDPSSVDILPEGTNGFLANLDLVNAVVRLANKHSIEPIVNNQLSSKQRSVEREVSGGQPPTITEQQINRTDVSHVSVERRHDGTLKRSAYRNPTWSGQYINFSSFVPLKQKRNLIHSLTSRGRKTCSDDGPFICNTLSVPSCHATRRQHEGRGRLLINPDRYSTAQSQWLKLLPYGIATPSFVSRNALFACCQVVEKFSDSAATAAYDGQLSSIYAKGDTSTLRQWLRSELTDIGLEVYEQNFSFTHHILHPVEEVVGNNLYAIMRSPSGGRAEAILLTVPLSTECSAAVSPCLSPTVGLLVSLMKVLRQQVYWAKDIVLLFVDSDYIGLLAWLEAYHGADTSKYLSWSEIQGRSGNIQAGLNLEFSHLDPSSVDILPEGTNGFLANLDLVNAVVRLANKHSIEPIVNNQVKTT